MQCTGPVFPGCLPVAQCYSRRCGDPVHVRGSVQRSKKGLQMLTMCGTLASSLIVNTHTYQQCEIVKMSPTSSEAHIAICAATLGSREMTQLQLQRGMWYRGYPLQIEVKDGIQLWSQSTICQLFLSDVVVTKPLRSWVLEWCILTND